jgi:hypothetical protein
MSIATEQKVERLLKRVDDLELEVSELRGLVQQTLEKVTAPTKDPNATRPTKR